MMEAVYPSREPFFFSFRILSNYYVGSENLNHYYHEIVIHSYRESAHNF